MSLYVCPAAVIAAPCATVWQVVTNIPSDPGWLGGVHAEHVTPAGPLQPGQTLLFSGAPFGRRLYLTMEIDAMDEQKGVIDMRVLLPFGMTNHEHMSFAPLPNGACRVQFG